MQKHLHLIPAGDGRALTHAQVEVMEATAGIVHIVFKGTKHVQSVPFLIFNICMMHKQHKRNECFGEARTRISWWHGTCSHRRARGQRQETGNPLVWVWAWRHNKPITQAFISAVKYNNHYSIITACQVRYIDYMIGFMIWKWEPCGVQWSLLVTKEPHEGRHPCWSPEKLSEV